MQTKPKINLFCNLFHRIWPITLHIFLLICLNNTDAAAQQEKFSFFVPSDTFNTKRFYPVVLSGGLVYTGAIIALDQAWYAQQPRGRFRFYNDWPSYKQMDKAGHALTAYWENDIIYKGARWTGMSKNKALITGAAVASGLQLTIEVMDGFVESYGFSWTDFAFNTLGVGLFTSQEYWWDNQMFVLKISGRQRAYDTTPILAENGNAFSSAAIRADALFGTFFAERLLKDYNAQTYWLSIFPGQWIKNSPIPPYLGISLGYSAENMLGEYNNSWMENAYRFSLDQEYPRYRQYFLSLDIDLNKIPVKSPFLKSLFSVINFLKIPFPAIQYNSLGQWKAHGIYY